VEQVERKLDQNIRFWAVLGPFILLLSFFILIFRSAPNSYYLPLAALIGTPICWKWKLPGLALALTFLGASLIFSLNSLALEDRYWEAGMAMAIALGFIVTSLSLEEVTALIQGLEIESNSRKESLWQLDERLKETEKQMIGSERKLNLQLREKDSLIENQMVRIKAFENLEKMHHKEAENLRYKIYDLENKLQETQTRINTVAEETRTIKDQKLHLEKEYQIHLLKNQTTQKEIENQQFRQSQFEKDILTFAQKHQHLIEEIQSIKTRNSELETQIAKEQAKKEEQESLVHSQQELMNSKHSEVEQLQTTLSAQNEALKTKENELLQLQEQLNNRPVVMHEQITLNPVLDKPAHHYESLYRQTRTQFLEKDSLLAATRRELFKAKEALLVM